MARKAETSMEGLIIMVVLLAIIFVIVKATFDGLDNLF
jgi:hypothetical protein